MSQRIYIIELFVFRHIKIEHLRHGTSVINLKQRRQVQLLTLLQFMYVVVMITLILFFILKFLYLILGNQNEYLYVCVGIDILLNFASGNFW